MLMSIVQLHRVVQPNGVRVGVPGWLSPASAALEHGCHPRRGIILHWVISAAHMEHPAVIRTRTCQEIFLPSRNVHTPTIAGQLTMDCTVYATGKASGVSCPARFSTR